MINETLSQVRGRCFTLSTDKIFRSGHAVELSLKPDGAPILVYMHVKGEEFWVNADYWPGKAPLEGLEEPTHCTLRQKGLFTIH